MVATSVPATATPPVELFPTEAVSGETNSPTPTAPMASETAVQATSTAGAALTPYPSPTPVPQLWLSEIMVNPNAVSDSRGEWLEIANPNAFAVDLNGWTLADAGSDIHVVEGPLVLPPGDYLVLARNADPLLNGGVSVDYTYTGIQLGNSADELLLIAPDDRLVDRMFWNKEMPVSLPSGASLERIEFGVADAWRGATAAWVGSLGDWGSPGFAAPIINPTATATPEPNPAVGNTPAAGGETMAPPTQTPVGEEEHSGTALLPLTFTSTPTVPSVTPTASGSETQTPQASQLPQTPTPSATPTRPATQTPSPTKVTATATLPPASEAPQPTSLPVLHFSEVMINPKAVSDSAGEYFEIVLTSNEAVNLEGWAIGDLGTEQYRIDEELWIVPGQPLLFARNENPHENGGLPSAHIYSGISLANGSDELILYSPHGVEVDRITWGEDRGLSSLEGISFERIGFSPDGGWLAAESAWQGSAGDWGSPGAIRTIATSAGVKHIKGFTFVPLVMAADVPAAAAQTQPTATKTAVTSTPTPTSTSSPYTTSAVPTSTSSATGAVNLPASLPVQLFIGEVMANPKAAKDSSGEYVEICNDGASATNLRGWILADGGTERHEIAQDLWVPPAGCLVMGRNGDRTLNGGVPVQYVYTGISLANSTDELLLIAPSLQQIDHIVWHPESDVSVTAGASLERVVLGRNRAWQTAQTSWSGSAGDAGSPGIITTAFAVVPTPTVRAETGEVAGGRQKSEVIAKEVSGATPALKPTAAATATATPADQFPRAEQLTASESVGEALMSETANSSAQSPVPAEVHQPRLYITEFMANPKAARDQVGEWLEIGNLDDVAINLLGWSIGDAKGEMHRIDSELWIEPGKTAVLARSSDTTSNGGIFPDYIYSEVTLANSEDEIILTSPRGRLIDRVFWGEGSSLLIEAGVSHQSHIANNSRVWTLAEAPWNGSAGDWGAPGKLHPSLLTAILPAQGGAIESESEPASSEVDSEMLSQANGLAAAELELAETVVDGRLVPLPIMAQAPSSKQIRQAGNLYSGVRAEGGAKTYPSLRALSQTALAKFDQSVRQPAIPSTLPKSKSAAPEVSLGRKTLMNFPAQSHPSLQICLTDALESSGPPTDAPLLCGQFEYHSGESTIYLTARERESRSNAGVRPELIRPESSEEPQLLDGYFWIIVLLIGGMTLMHMALLFTLCRQSLRPK